MKRGMCTFLIFTTLVSTTVATNAQVIKVSNDNEKVENLESKAWSNIYSFGFYAKNNPEVLNSDILGYISKNNEILCVVPNDVDISKLVATFGASSTNVTIDGVGQQSDVTVNDFSNQLTYTVGGNNTYIVNVVKSDLPTMEINTENGQAITSKEDYVNASMKLTGTEEITEGLFDGSIQIRGRGNSTWGMAKKPYRIKLGKKSNLLGMGVEKDWVLLANYSDKTLVRNKLALDLAAEMGMEYTSESRYVNVILNGEYIGNYLLCEQVEVSETRVDIDELEDTDTSEDMITGGYLFEVDYRFDADTCYKSSLGVPFTFKSPKLPNKEQYNYVTNYIEETEKALTSKDFTYNGKHYSEYIDVDSFIDYYWINEVFKNWDAAFRTSVNMYKPRDGKLTMGPIWDFDIAAGNADFKDFQPQLDNTSVTDWWMRYEGWYGVLFNDPEFVEKVNNRFWELIDVFEGIEEKINTYTETIENSQSINFKRWSILGQYVWPNVFVGKTYEEDVNYLKNWFNGRIEWLKENVPQPETPEEKPDENVDFDINKDGKVNVGDVAVISKNYGVYNKAMDLNKDGKVDKEDIAILMDELLK